MWADITVGQWVKLTYPDGAQLAGRVVELPAAPDPEPGEIQLVRLLVYQLGVLPVDVAGASVEVVS